MASSSHPSLPHPLGHPHHPPPSSSAASTSSTKPNSEFPTLPQNPSSNGRASSEKNPNSGAAITAAPEDVHLCNSSHLTHQEVLRRRAHNFNQLATVYKDHYWAMMEELKAKYKEYVWKFGLSPFKEGEEKEIFKEEVEDDGIEGKGEMGSEVNRQCLFHGCALKAMPLTKFCSLHILSDPKQVLYKPCEYVIKSAQMGQITCGRPIVRSKVPALCNVHLQKAHRALKKAGLPIPSSSKLAPKFHVIVAEYVQQIQAKRRAALRANGNSVVVKQESCN
ncbi:INO80 complex subunit D-like [Camellia sinensis]|uniref:INO80 complex subunit D-like n=1 Tax=Camellia sinensis TaxID=4442 RepID=UPI0010364529|nr:INO80 complex subunit D-like [Camellia sinensis]